MYLDAQRPKKSPAIHRVKLVGSWLSMVAWGFLVWFLVTEYPLWEISATIHVPSYTNLLLIAGWSWLAGLAVIVLLCAMWVE